MIVLVITCEGLAEGLSLNEIGDLGQMIPPFFLLVGLSRDGEQSKSMLEQAFSESESKRRSDEEKQRAAKFHPKRSAFRAF